MQVEAELEAIQSEVTEASKAHGDLRYTLAEGSSDDFPYSWDNSLISHQVRSIFPVGNHRTSHILSGSVSAVDAFRRISERIVAQIPPSLRYEVIPERNGVEIECINGILALDRSIGETKYGRKTNWYRIRHANGSVEQAASAHSDTNGNFELIPDSFKEAVAAKRQTVESFTRTMIVWDVFRASSEAISQLELRLRMPSYFEMLVPSFTTILRVVWEVEDLAAAIRNAGLIEGIPARIGRDGDCGFMLALLGIRHYLNRDELPWGEWQCSEVRGWRYVIGPILNHLGQIMHEIYGVQGWSAERAISISSDREKIPKFKPELLTELTNIGDALRSDGLEALTKDASVLGASQRPSLVDRARVSVDEIDSFSAVRSTSAVDLSSQLFSNGKCDVLEDDFQLLLEKILSVPIHKYDWPGEEADLFTSNVQFNGRRILTAFALNGRGKMRAKEFRLKDCGANGNQLTKLFQLPAELFVFQCTCAASEDIEKEMADKAALLRYRGKPAFFCVIDGQDTARLITAYSSDGRKGTRQSDL